MKKEHKRKHKKNTRVESKKQKKDQDFKINKTKRREKLENNVYKKDSKTMQQRVTGELTAKENC